MWSEEFDKKIRSAAENDSTAFNEKAWDTMLPLLDQHLPKEKKRRWAFLWLFGLLISATAIFFIVQNKSTRTSGVTKTETSNPQKELQQQPVIELEKNTKDNLITTEPKHVTSPDSDDKDKIVGADKNVLKTNEKELTPTSDKIITGEKDKQPSTIVKGEVGTNNKEVAGQKKSTTRSNQSTKQNQRKKNVVGEEWSPSLVQQPLKQKQTVQTKDQTKVKDSDTQSDGNSVVNDKDRSVVATIPTSSDKTSIIPKTDSIANTDISKKDDVKSPLASDSAATKAEPIVKNKKPSSAKGSRFSIGISAGPDISAVSENIGKVKMQYGIGVGYAINDRFTVRTGFYVSRKVYTADSADYHPPKSFWTYFDNLQTVDANCLVYEIPLNVVYNFPSSKKDNWFVSGGVSSYLMKKETYGYTFKNSWNQPDYYSRIYKSENNHFFSVLNISGGYRHQISRSFSLMAEPYIRMPLSGVGFGKVKLNSGGLIFTASFKPFLKRK